MEEVSESWKRRGASKVGKSNNKFRLEIVLNWRSELDDHRRN